MPRYKFDQIAYNITEKKMPEPGEEKMYIGLDVNGIIKIPTFGGENSPLCYA